MIKEKNKTNYGEDGRNDERIKDIEERVKDMEIWHNRRMLSTTIKIEYINLDRESKRNLVKT